MYTILYCIGEALLHTMLDLRINRPQAKIYAFGMKQQTVKHSPQQGLLIHEFECKWN